MKVSKMNVPARHDLLRSIGEGLTRMAHSSDTDDETLEVLLDSLVDALDELDQDDYLGTEGWKYTFGIED